MNVGAVDLGASSGRVMVGRVDVDLLELVEVHRFGNVPVRVAGTLHWDILGVYRGVLDGLRAAGLAVGELASVGIDSWAVDYGLLDGRGQLLGNPVHYRDARTEGVAEQAFATVPEPELYASTGIQHLPFNTVFQLLASAKANDPQLATARTLLLIPDLLSYWLTGLAGAELTNASTTQLLDVHSGQWSAELMRRLGISRELFPPIRLPGDPAGELKPEVCAETGLNNRTAVTAVGSHDTASAVVAVPAATPRFGYISCGTWSLVGVELTAPVLSEDSRRANFTNEAGVDGTIRYLRNVMGLWLLQESLRTWGGPALEPLLSEAAGLPTGPVIDPNHSVFLPPNDHIHGDMPTRIARQCRESGQPAPTTPAQTVRCILDSLAQAYHRALVDAQRLSGREIDVVHVVGGGARNELLCQLTADACGLPVVAGPVEATALGNVLVQARAAGAVGGGLGELRALLRRTQPTRRHHPARH